MRIVLRRVHLIASLIAGLWLAISALSGAALVFGDRLDRALHPELFGTGPGGANLDRVIASAEKASGLPARRIRLASEGSPAHEVWLECDKCLRAWVDPVSGSVLDLRSPTETSRGFLHELHRRMLAGRSGEVAVGIGGIALLTVSITGLILFLPRSGWRSAFRFRFSCGWRRANFDLHRAVGLAVLPLLIAAGASGLYFIFHGPFDRVASRIDGAALWPSAEIVQTGAPLPLSNLVAAAEREVPGARLTWLSLPTGPSQPLVVRFRQPGENHPNGRTFVRVDPYRGSVIHVADAFEAPRAARLLAELYPLHVGETGGFSHKLLLVLAGLSVPALFISGLIAWWNRSLKRVWAARSRRPNLISPWSELPPEMTPADRTVTGSSSRP